MLLCVITFTDEEAKVMPLPQITPITRVWLWLSAAVTLGFACTAFDDVRENIHT